MKTYLIRRWAFAPAAILALAVLLLLVLAVPAAPALEQARPAQPAPAEVRAAPLNPDFVLWQATRSFDAVRQSIDGLGLGERPAPHALYKGNVTAMLQPTETYAASYDLRTTGKLTPVKDQNPFGTCWTFATYGSMESCLLPGESRDFSEDHMVLTSGFDMNGATTPAQKYDAGGQIWMSTAYLARWGGPVWESEDAYGDSFTPGGLSPRKHVQNVSWYAQRASATDNDRIKYAITTHGGAYISMSWQGSSSGSSYYNPTTHAFYYNGSLSTNHAVLVVGWDDTYAASNFATTPPGNGAFIVRNSWGTGWGESGFFYVSYHDTRFGRTSYAATFEGAQATSNYDAVYQHDRLGDVNTFGTGSSTTYWGANAFTATATSTLDAVGFYAEAPNTAYEVWEGSSLAGLTKITQGTLPQMGFHTVALPTKPALTGGAGFVVAVKLTTPGNNWPLPIEYPVAGYSSAATASPGQSFISSNGTSWTDLTSWDANANVCLKAYATTGSSPAGDITAPVTAASGADDLWHNRDVAITLTASDESGGSGVASIVGSFDGGAEVAVAGASAVATIAASRNHSNDGVTTLSYYATDKAGNREAAHAATVKIDTRGPTCAAKNAIVRRGKKGRLYFAVRDALSPQATQTVRIKTRRGATKKTFSWGYDDVRGSGQWWYINYRWTLKKGTYFVFVSGKDLAGNKASVIGKAKLVVR